MDKFIRTTFRGRCHAIWETAQTGNRSQCCLRPIPWIVLWRRRFFRVPVGSGDRLRRCHSYQKSRRRIKKDERLLGFHSCGGSGGEILGSLSALQIDLHLHVVVADQQSGLGDHEFGGIAHQTNWARQSRQWFVTAYCKYWQNGGRNGEQNKVLKIEFVWNFWIVTIKKIHLFRNLLYEIYFGKTRDIVNGLRSVQALSDSQKQEDLRKVMMMDLAKKNVTKAEWFSLAKKKAK